MGKLKEAMSEVADELCERHARTPRPSWAEAVKEIAARQRTNRFGDAYKYDNDEGAQFIKKVLDHWLERRWDDEWSDDDDDDDDECDVDEEECQDLARCGFPTHEQRPPASPCAVNAGDSSPPVLPSFSVKSLTQARSDVERDAAATKMVEFMRAPMRRVPCVSGSDPFEAAAQVLANATSKAALDAAAKRMGALMASGHPLPETPPLRTDATTEAWIEVAVPIVREVAATDDSACMRALWRAELLPHVMDDLTREVASMVLRHSERDEAPHASRVRMVSAWLDLATSVIVHGVAGAKVLGDITNKHSVTRLWVLLDTLGDFIERDGDTHGDTMTDIIFTEVVGAFASTMKALIALQSHAIRSECPGALVQLIRDIPSVGAEDRLKSVPMEMYSRAFVMQRSQCLFFKSTRALSSCNAADADGAEDYQTAHVLMNATAVAASALKAFVYDPARHDEHADRMPHVMRFGPEDMEMHIAERLVELCCPRWSLLFAPDSDDAENRSEYAEYAGHAIDLLKYLTSVARVNGKMFSIPVLRRAVHTARRMLDLEKALPQIHDHRRTPLANILSAAREFLDAIDAPQRGAAALAEREARAQRVADELAREEDAAEALASAASVTTAQ